MANSKFIKFNFNPWRQRIPDCFVRAVCAATGLDYREVCKKYGISYKNGKGVIRDTGLSLRKIEQVFSDYFDVVENFSDDMDFVPDEYVDSKENAELQKFDIEHGIDSASGITLNEFVDLFKDKGTFLVSLKLNPEVHKNAQSSRIAGHITCVKCIPGKKQGFIDTWDCGDMLVDAYMRVIKKEPADSPLHWKYDKEKHEFII